ncbi:hypothetical protein [Halococcus sp. IIIV-5B]|uniref:hypothetical protein n=1 Tax=Halococcus sp. IIIV-5B TaxID=2321230 RepID=UPI000E74714A|nr:hypothetical protein [Halococcus sp. IIIV-5B]RJS97760.1 hypothetical protein D3261_17715 [Halococcus sp. IIIV-5B]
MSDSTHGSDAGTPSTGRRTTPVRHTLLCLAAVVLLAAGTYRGTTGYWFVAADSLTLIETSRVRNLADLVDLFTQPLMHGSSFTDIALFYRPVSSLSYAVDYALWGLRPAGYHLTNVVLHVVAAALVTLVVADLTSRLAVGTLGGGLFAVHPLTVGLVPAVPRRQDVLLTVFVLVAVGLFVRGRREDRPRLLGGALVAYALALGAKETALAVPLVVFAWVAIDRTGPWRTRVRHAIPATLPFVGVTAVYVVVRLAVLGGLGGYQGGTGSGPGGSIAFLPLKLLLWLGQPTSLVETMPDGLRGVALVLVAIGVLVGALLVRRARRRLDPPALRSWRVCLALFAAFYCTLALTERSGTAALVDGGASTVVRYLVDSLFVGGCLAGLLAAVRTADPFDAATRRLVGFFVSWLVAVPGLLVVTGAGLGTPLELGDQIQTGYLCLVPAMAGLSLVAVAAGERVVAAGRSNALRPDANLVTVGFAVVLVASLVVTSPLVHPYPEWEEKGAMNQQELTELEDGSDALALTAAVSADGRSDPGDETGPMASSIGRLSDYSVAAWLRLRTSAWHGHVPTSDGDESAVPRDTFRPEWRMGAHDGPMGGDDVVTGP